MLKDSLVKVRQCKSLLQDLAANEQLMRQRQAEAMQNAYQQRANDVNAAYGRMPNYA